jgi:hypothetical protein
MNLPFFVVRSLLCLGVWSVVARLLFRRSTSQDNDSDLQSSVWARRIAPLATTASALALMVASFDWIMSLEPTWYSTIFGVYVFAGAMAAHAAVLVLALAILQRAGLVKTWVTVEHYHDLGKLLFGWICFWAYIAFSQFFLIWYSNVPEEVAFFHRRWTDEGSSWRPLAGALVYLHFAAPFAMLLSRGGKRSRVFLVASAAIIVVLHAVDVYWLALPCAGECAPSWLDLAAWLGVGGVYAAVVLRAMARHALVPLGDPRLDRALAFENA